MPTLGRPGAPGLVNVFLTGKTIIIMMCGPTSLIVQYGTTKILRLKYAYSELLLLNIIYCTVLLMKTKNTGNLLRAGKGQPG